MMPIVIPELLMVVLVATAIMMMKHIKVDNVIWCILSTY